MKCKQCGKEFPHSTGSYCGGCQKALPQFKGLTPQQLADRLLAKTERLGMDCPSQDMVAETINTAISEVLLWVGGRWHDAYHDQLDHRVRCEQEWRERQRVHICGDPNDPCDCDCMPHREPPEEPVRWVRCDWIDAQQHRERMLTGSIGLEGRWSEWMNWRPGSLSAHKQYEYRRKED